MPKKINADGFDSGVDFGGLREKNDIKLLMCYLLTSVGGSVSETVLNEALLSNGLANYFKAGEAIAELVDAGNVTVEDSDGERLYAVTGRGSVFADEIETSLPLSVREKALNTALQLISERKNASQTDFTSQKVSDGVRITLTIREGDVQLLSISLLVADELQALRIKENFISDPSLVFSGTTALLARKPEILEAMLKDSLPGGRGSNM